MKSISAISRRFCVPERDGGVVHMIGDIIAPYIHCVGDTETEIERTDEREFCVIPRTLLEKFNEAEEVPIPTEELGLFLKFQNDIGTILYFNIEVLKDKIVLVPQWMIDALKSLITAKKFVLKKALAVADKWDMFNKSGTLSLELIDAIWTKENYPDLHDNKEHILLLMEHLNIIARPRCFSEDGSEIK
ncbi:hypothetical protein ACJMK2_013544, partial [Sinanodonta woodiana]